MGIGPRPLCGAHAGTAGQPVKFTYRVNDNAGVGCLELAKQRSVSKQNNFAFLVRWTEHWANEVEFVFE